MVEHSFLKVGYKIEVKDTYYIPQCKHFQFVFPYPVFLSPWWPAERGLLFAHLLQFHQDQRLFLEQLAACPKIQDPSESLTRIRTSFKTFRFSFFPSIHN